jgi:alkanesulfonate monooxygenase SsuD/methylene tetrahydromethanopterin reductase-like flavin-dependent oxidoreductase (luciferase family)
MIESISLLKRLWTEDDVTFQGEYYNCSGVTIGPKPLSKPRPQIWIANNAVGRHQLVEGGSLPGQGAAEAESADQRFVRGTLRRVARHADGWQTAGVFPATELARRLDILHAELRELGRDPVTFASHLYHNININDDEDAAFAESKRFLDEYYGPVFSDPMVRNWTVTGSPARCAEMLRQLEGLGFDEVTLRITSWDQETQFRRLREEVLPLLDLTDSPASVRSTAR